MKDIKNKKIKESQQLAFGGFTDRDGVGFVLRDGHTFDPTQYQTNWGGKYKSMILSNLFTTVLNNPSR